MRDRCVQLVLAQPDWAQGALVESSVGDHRGLAAVEQPLGPGSEEPQPVVDRVCTTLDAFRVAETTLR